MDADRKRNIFDYLRNNLLAAGLSTSDQTSIICPLCWNETAYDQLSIEHVIPSSVGGNTITLSCQHCNNTHGRDLDAHLVNHQKLADAFKGVGTIPAKMRAFGQEVTTNVNWGSPGSGKHIAIVGKASNPAASDAIQAEFKKGIPDNSQLTLEFGYSKNRFQTALLRCAYLVLFRIFGYHYIRNHVVQLVRRRIVDPSLDIPDIRTLVGVVKRNSVIVDNDYYVIHRFMDGIPFFQVVIRLKCTTESYQFVMMPVPHMNDDQFFVIAAKIARENPTLTFKNVPPQAIFTDAEQINVKP